MKSISKRKEKDILLLKARLDEYNDEWRTADTSDTASNNFPSLIRANNQNKPKKPTRKYKKNTDKANSDGVTTNGSKESTNKGEGKVRKKKAVSGIRRQMIRWEVETRPFLFPAERAKQQKGIDEPVRPAGYESAAAVIRLRTKKIKRWPVNSLKIRKRFYFAI